tara:strand:- start:4097 stop:4735 length:639 start_codon:yes stop_codon:yes gene_type:complete
MKKITLTNIQKFLKNVDFKYFFYEKFLLLIGSVYVILNSILYGKKFKIGKKYRVWGRIRFLIDGEGKIEIGNRFHAVSSRNRSYITIFSPCHLTSIHGGNIKIGNHVGLNGNTIVSRKLIKIGDDTMIGPNTMILDSDGHNVAPDKRWGNSSDAEEIIIENNCWIGMNCIIMKGVRIGKNSVIGAGSVVVKNCEPNSVYAGNPAKKIKKIKI